MPRERPQRRRADRKRKTRGLLGGLWDDVAVGYKMRDCPCCRAKYPQGGGEMPVLRGAGG